jgi:NAD(P)-dependent dehydrogenase (short-subunit alcohol dehydrogenase family)
LRILSRVNGEEGKSAADRGRPSIKRGVSCRAVVGRVALAAAMMAWAPGEAHATDRTGGLWSGVDHDPEVILITGSTSGLGHETAIRLARTGAHIIIHGRDVERGQDVVAEIEAEGIGSARFYAADFALLDNVRGFAEAILRDYDRLDVLINNAGIGSTAPERQVSRDGHELRFQVNYLAPFMLTELLLDLIMDSAPSRIIHVASSAQSPIDFDDVMIEQGYTGGRAYGQSKLAQILHTFDLAEELEGTGVIVNALHPATFMDTPMVTATGRTPFSTVEEGADAVINLVLNPDMGSGQYFNQMFPTEAHEQAYDRDARAQLRAISLQLVGLD